MLSGWSSTIKMCTAPCMSLYRFSLPEEALDLGDHRAGLTGLGEIAIAPDFHRLLPVRRQRVGGQRDNRNVVRRRVVLEHLCGFPPVDNGDRDIHQDEIGSLRSR